MNEFFIGVQILLDQLIESCMFIQASRGGGKSTLIRKLNEVFNGHCQQIIIDIEGEFVTLREKFPFALLAVSGGDIPLNVKHAATYARKFMESHLSVIIDISDLVPRDREIFVRDFLHALMNLPAKLYHPLLLYIDEVAKFCPQDEKALSTSAVIDVAARGRKRDIGLIAATQRVSNVHKDLTGEMGNKMIGRTFQDIDQIRAGKELGWKAAESRALRSVKPGQFFCFGPALTDEIHAFKVDKVLTTHKKKSSKMLIPPTPKEIQSLIGALSDLPAEAENDLKTLYGLQQEVTRLNHMLTHSGKQPISALDTIAEIQEPLKKEIQRLRDHTGHLEEKVIDMEEINVRQEKVLDAHRSFIANLFHDINVFKELYPDPKRFIPFPEGDDPSRKSWIQQGQKLAYPYMKVGDGPIIKTEDLGNGLERENMDYGDGMIAHGPAKEKEKPWAELVITQTEDVPREEPPVGKMGKTILQFLFTWDAGFTEYQLGLGCEYSHSSGSFKDALRQLKRLGYVLGHKDDLCANMEDFKILREVQELTGDRLNRKKLTSAAYWTKLGAMEKNIASFVHMSHVTLFSADGIAEHCKYSPTSGSFKDALRNLVKLELLVKGKAGSFHSNPDVPIV